MTTSPKNETPSAPRPHAEANAHAANAADQRIAALRSQLAMMQAERSLLHARSTTTSTPPPTRRAHGVGGWVFAGLSFVFFLAMMVFATTRPQAVRVVEVEVTREVFVPAPPEVAVVTEVEEPATREPEAVRPRPRPRPIGNTRDGTTVTGMSVGPRLDIDACGGDPLCGS